MPYSSKLKMYGENAATFLIFQLLAMSPEAISRVLLSKLKRFDNGRTLMALRAAEAEVWLFPSFGKRYGFGEPDVLLIVGQDVYWFEVETSIDCQRHLSELHKSLLQLRRFRLLQSALARRPKRVRGELRIEGNTISNAETRRKASFKIAGHGVYKSVASKLIAAGETNRDHYVLFSINKPRGPGNGRSYATQLKKSSQACNTICPELDSIPIERCWYAYWEGDLKSRFEEISGRAFDFDGQCIQIKKSK